MIIDDIRKFIKEKAEEFGANIDPSKDRQQFERNNTTAPGVLDDGGGYFGFISPEEEASGAFHDFSFTIFPSNPNHENEAGAIKPWLVCLGIGSSGFKNDYELSTYPGVRRLFSKLINENGFCKSDFSDIETRLPKSFTGKPKLLHFKKTFKMNDYDKVLPVCQIVENPESNEGKKTISAFLAGYARLREWPSNKKQRDAVATALEPFIKTKKSEITTEIKALLKERKYVVLQGPPGTGKTRAAKVVAEELTAKVFFTQFHAETSFSDFIVGIRPSLNDGNLVYVETLGIFAEAIKYANSNSKETVVLIIDEINRANLSNILGPIFYLFEYKMDQSDIEIEISTGFKVKNLPDNFYVIATMNTADRSLAVVDFALRRRFAWYSLKPQTIHSKKFFEKDFNRIKEIFEWYASSTELSLQPGQGYFIADTDNEITNRIQYEIFPLIKEYLQEGFLRNAKEEFNDYFVNRINQSLFE